MKVLSNIIKVSVLIVVSLLANPAYSMTLSFSCVTANDVTGEACATAQSQMSVDVNDAGSGVIEFVFNNSGSDLSAFIADVYFYDGAYIDPTSVVISNSPDVSFESWATPGHLPGYDGIDNVTYSADSSAPVAKNGIQSGEWLGISFSLLSGVSYADAVAALQGAGADDFTLGIHVQGLNDGVSESLITVPTVPVPAAFWLFGSGLIGIVAVARRRV